MRNICKETSFFEPKAIVVIGISEKIGSIGRGIYLSLTEGFRGKVYGVNPNYEKIFGKPCLKSIEELPDGVTHAVLVVKRELVCEYVCQCIRKGVSNLIIVSAGFKEVDDWGRQMEEYLSLLCRKHRISMLGPNTLGFINTTISLNCTFLPNQFSLGSISVISQSGGVGMALLSALKDRHCGISKWVGIGNEAVIDAETILEYLNNDSQTKVIAVCFEGLSKMQLFLQCAEKVNLHKPVVILRDGKSKIGMQAALSHTGTMAQSEQVMRGIFHQARILEADSCEKCAAMLKALSISQKAMGNRVAILTNTAGPAILAADILEKAEIDLRQPSFFLRKELNKITGIMNHIRNPIDLSSNGLDPHKYGSTAECLLKSDEYDALLAFFSLNPALQLPEQELIKIAKQSEKPIIICFLGDYQQFDRYDRLPESAGIPCYCTPQDAAAAMVALTKYTIRERKDERETPFLHKKCLQRLRAYIAEKEKEKKQVLTEVESKAFLSLAGIKTVMPRLVKSVKEAVKEAENVGYPVALKVHSEKIVHKSDISGVRLNLFRSEDVELAAKEILERARSIDETAFLTVQPMAPDGFEMICGAVQTPKLGSLVMMGAGGIYSEIYQDVEFRIPPVDNEGLEDMLNHLKCGVVFQKYRGKGGDKKEFFRLMKILMEIIEKIPQIKEIEMNPCRIYKNQVLVLDARIVLGNFKENLDPFAGNERN